MSISHMIRMALAHKNMKEAELARSVGMIPATFNYRMQIEKFSSDELSKIAETLGAKMTIFLEFPDGTNLTEHMKPIVPQENVNQPYWIKKKSPKESQKKLSKNP